MSESPFTPTRFERIEQLFHAAVGQPPERRAEIVREGSAGDPSLQEEVLALLAAHDSTGARLVSPVSPAAIREAGVKAERWIGARLGAYEITRRIGDGGMGTVYEAVRADEEFSRRVAIKLLRHGLESELAIRRFRTERQILANLTHPNIAALLDGGTTPDGQPYIVMEHVEGVPITKWCDARGLSVRERIEVFVQVCAAVQFAHQNLVVHRDLKPSNLLVGEPDPGKSGGTVKLLDFGIAKLLPAPQKLATDPTRTHFGQRAFTPDYAAPEQFRDQTVGTATDVYALGGILFELLTGRRPLELEGKSFHEVETTVCESKPPRPSAAIREAHVSALGERSLARARDRIQGDLDAIVLMALRKEPERRYGSAEQLARDLRSHLDGLPVAARPDGVGYRMRKFVRRRRLEVAAAVLLVLSLVGGMVATTLQARRAEAESERAQQVTTFLESMIWAASPTVQGREVTVREMIDSAAVRVHELRDRPRIEAEIRAMIGMVYENLGEYALAEEQLVHALDARRRSAPRGDLSTAIALTRLAKTLDLQGRYEAADSLFVQAWAIVDRHPGSWEDVGIWLNNHGRVLFNLGRIPEARQKFEEALQLSLKHEPHADSSLMIAYSNLAVLVFNMAEYAAADTLMHHGLVRGRRYHDKDHPELASVMSSYANMLSVLGEDQRADSMYRATIEMRRRVLGEEHPDLAWPMANFASHLNDTGRPDEAARLAREALTQRGRSVPEADRSIPAALMQLGRALARMDSLPAAEQRVREALEHRRTNLPVGHWLISYTESALAEVLTLAGRYDEAERLLLHAEVQLTQQRGEGTEPVDVTRRRLAALYHARAEPAKAAEWRARISPRYTAVRLGS